MRSGRSSAGVVLGIAQTAVKPPATAAEVPLTMVLLVLLAGDAQVDVEINQAGADGQTDEGRTARPPARPREGPIHLTRPSATHRLPGDSRPVEGSRSKTRRRVKTPSLTKRGRSRGNGPVNRLLRAGLAHFLTTTRI